MARGQLGCPVSDEHVDGDTRLHLQVASKFLWVNPYQAVASYPVLTDNRNWMASTPSLPIDDDTWYRKEGEHETQESNSSAGWKGKSPTPLRRSASLSADTSLCASPEPSTRTLVDTLLVQIGTSDHEGWMRKKGGHSGKWRNRYLVLKGPYLYWLGDDNAVVCVTWLADVRYFIV